MTTQAKPVSVTTEQSAPSVQQQAGKLLTQFAGFVGLKTIKIGIDNGLFSTLAEHEEGLTAQELAAHAETDEFYTGVWARAAYAAEVIEIDGQNRYTLAAHVNNLILNEEFPGFIGGITGVFNEPEIFDNFSLNLKSGQRVWWDETSPEFIHAVSGTGKPF